MSETNPAEQRQFERHSLEFEVEVYAAQDETKVLIERSVLINVSGGGVCFLSKRPDLYCPEQKIFLHICMPGTDKMLAGMECVTRVAWIHHMQSGETEKQQAAIGVTIEGMLSFEKTILNQGCDDRKSEQQP